MSQPFNRACNIPSPGTPDRELGEFWVNNPWHIATRHNLSAYERNRMFWNVDGHNFVDISFVCGTDSDGDGRAAVAADFNNDGRLDLVVRQAGGGALQLFENRFNHRHWLRVTLRGNRSNRLGIGARLVASVGGRKLFRNMNAVNSYYSRAPAVVHFGLGDAERIDELTVHWPTGLVQAFTGLQVDRHLVLEEGNPLVQTAEPGRVIEP